MIGQVRNVVRKWDTLYGDIHTKDRGVYRIMSAKFGHERKIYSLLKDGDYVNFTSYSNDNACEIGYILEKDNNQIKYNKIDAFKSLNDTTNGATVVLKDLNIIIEASYDQKDYTEKETFCYNQAFEKLTKKAKKLGGNATINSSMKRDLIWKGPGGKNLVTMFTVSGTVAIIGQPSFNGIYTRDELIELHLSETPKIFSFIDKLKLLFKKIDI